MPQHTRTLTHKLHTDAAEKQENCVCIICVGLTSSLFTVHVRFAAGRECRDVQLPRNMSPTRYRGRIPVMNGALCGVSVNVNATEMWVLVGCN